MCKCSKDVASHVKWLSESYWPWDYTKFAVVAVPLFWGVIVPGVFFNVFLRAYITWSDVQEQKIKHAHKKKKASK